MRITGILLSGLIFLMSCSKDNDNIAGKKTPAQLLTQQQWLLLTAGFDDNKNGVVDGQENILDECQKGNIYTFNIAGSGTIHDIAAACTPTIIPDFSWSFSQEDKKLKISFLEYSVFRLNESELIISPDLPLDRTFIMTYGH
jgi:hypothetical protein